MITKYEKANRGKLLVAVMALAVVLAGAAVIFSDSEVNAADRTLEANETVSKDVTLEGTIVLDGYDYIVNSGTVSGGTIDASKGGRIVMNGGTLSGVTINCGPNSTVVTEQGLTSDVKITGCTFNGNGVAAIYIGLFSDKTQTITIENNTFNGTYSEGAVDFNMQSGSEAKIVITGETPVSVNMWAANGEATATVGTNLDVSRANVTKINMSSADATLSVPTGQELDVDEITGVGTLDVSGKVTAKIADSVSKVINDGADVEISGDLGLKDTINADTTIADNSYLSGNLTIPEGKTLTITSTGKLDLMNFDLTIEGTLVIERNGVITSSSSGVNSLVLMSNGSIQNSGIIGDKSQVKISNGTTDEDQYVSMQGVSGVSVGLERVTGTQNYNMVVSGDISRISGASANSLTINNVTIDDSMTIGKDVSVAVYGAVAVAKNVVVENKGTMNINGTFTLGNGAQFIVSNTVTGTVTVKTGEIKSGDEFESSVNSTFELRNVKGVTISAGRVTISNDDGTTSVFQRAYITGTATPVDSEKNSSIGFGNTIFIKDTLVIKKDVSISGTYTLDVCQDGTVESVINALTYCGAKYCVEATTTDGDDIYYYTTFDNAMASIADAADGKITVNGEFTISQSYALEANQSIEGTAKVTVAESAVITVNEDAAISNTALVKILGKVIVNDGGVYNPASGQGIYEVVSTNDETNTTTYSGFKVALADASAGDVIELVDNATYKGNMTVIDGVTVSIADGKALTVTGNVTVDEGGKIDLGSASQLLVGTSGKSASVNVAGEIDATVGTIGNVDGAKVNVYSTGSIVSSAAIGSTDNFNINSAYYTDGTTVYTSVAKAAAYASENGLNDIYATGTFSESGDVTLNSVTLNINDKSDVTLGNVTLDASKINATGKYSATVTGKSGSGDSAIDSTVSVSKTTADVESKYIPDATGVNEYSFTINAISGDVKISSGTVGYTGAGFTIDGDNTLEVASGATLVISEDGELNVTTSTVAGTDYNDNLVNNGTIVVKADVTIGSDMTIPGDITVTEGSVAVGGSDETSIALTITGTLTISDEEEKEGSMTVYGVLQVGSTPKMLATNGATGAVVGKVSLVGNAYVIAYAGASVADANITNGSTTAVKTTSFSVNSIQYATVYTYGTQTAGVVNSSVDNLTNLDETERADVTWYSGETDVGKTPAIGTYSELSTEIEWAGVDFKVSAGPGLEIYIDNVKNVDGTANLPIGEHTVTVYVKAGYEGTPSITINGQTISGETFTVTSDMLNGNNIIYATGATPIDYSQGGSSTGGDDGLGIVEILLIILVVVVVILAIFVVLRMMRS